MDPLLLAQEGASLSEFAREPILTVACIMLIVVSIGWVVIARLIWRELSRAARASAPRARKKPARRSGDVWNEPPG